MKTVLRFCLYILGLAAIAIGASIFLVGANFTATLFVALLGFMWGSQFPLVGLENANVDSELRFYSVFWMAYGGLLILSARGLLLFKHQIPVLLSVFFLGGIGRLLSLLSVGNPHPLFMVLMFIEIFTPTILIGVWLVSEMNE